MEIFNVIGIFNVRTDTVDARDYTLGCTVTVGESAPEADCG